MPIRLNTQADWAALHDAAPELARKYLRVAIRRDFGLALPDRVFTTGHSSPFDFVADCFFHPSKDVAAWANRSGIKTLGASILAALEFRYNPGLQARVLSGSEDQARFLYGYWTQWCSRILAEQVHPNAVNRLLTRVGKGKFEILAASQKRVRGGKVQRLYEDELDEIDPELDRAAAGMIASKPGTPGRTVYTSTWHRCDGPMQTMIDGCPDNGVTLHKWNVWESVAQCPEERNRGGAGCDDCKLAPACVGKAREFHSDPTRQQGIAAEANGLYQVADAIKAFLKVGKRTWEAEYECRRPSVEGLVYADFDADTHRCKTLPQHLTYYRAIDWGRNVFVCLWLGTDKEENVYVLDTYRAEKGIVATHAAYINAHKLQKIKATYVDPAGRNKSDLTGRSAVDEFEAAGIECDFTLAERLRSVQNGVGWIRAALTPASGPPLLYYVDTPNNRTFVRAMQSYHNRKVNGIWIDEPQKPQDWDHTPDALRYFYANMQKSGEIGVARMGGN